MKVVVNFKDFEFEADFSKPIDLSIPLTNSQNNPLAWYIEPPVIEPVRIEDWVGKVSEGKSSTNFNNILFNPHGHGTHTECLGHITHDFYSINKCLNKFFFIAELISVTPNNIDGDDIITKEDIQAFFSLQGNENQHKDSIIPEALIIRTLPNSEIKKSKNYSHTNPPYLSEEAVVFIRKKGIKHLLIDLPSVDKEKDEGKLLAHKAFWNVKNTKKLNDDARLDATITEMIYVPDNIKDGTYLLNLQIASFENDASPSKPILYKINQKNSSIGQI